MKVVMVVAEDRGLVESLRALLAEGDLLLVENSAEATLRRLVVLKPDAIIIDDSPRLGRQALQRLRAEGVATPIIVLASRGDTETRANFLVAGASACLSKPFDCEELKSIVDTTSSSSERPGLSPALVPPLAPIGSSRHQAALRWLNRMSASIQSAQRVASSLVEMTTDVFDSVRAVVLLGDDKGVRVAAQHGLPEAFADSIRLVFHSGLMRWFEEYGCLIDRVQAVHPDASKELAILSARIGVPLMSSGRVCGALLVGERASGGEYSHDDRELLTIIARCASVSLENAGLYADLAKKREQFDSVLGHIGTGVVSIAADRTIAMMNSSAERILQVRADEMIGRSVQKLGSTFADIVLRTLADRRPRLRQEFKDPAIDAVLGLSAAPQGDDGVVVVFSRLPSQSAATEEIAYSPFWEYLATRVAQEIKNPLVSISTFAQLLPRKYDSEDFRQIFADTVQKEVARINSVVETLFAFSQHPRLVLQRVRVNDTVQNVLRSFEHELRERSINIESAWDPHEPEAQLDTEYFAQAIESVIQNAIDAMPNGGVLKVRTQLSERTCEVVISDNGPGVAERDGGHIFMPFFSTKEQGMGLGLPLAHRILQQHQGELQLVPGSEGSSFALRVPACVSTDENHTGN